MGGRPGGCIPIPCLLCLSFQLTTDIRHLIERLLTLQQHVFFTGLWNPRQGYVKQSRYSINQNISKCHNNNLPASLLPLHTICNNKPQVWEESYATKRDLQLHVERLHLHQDSHSLHHQQARLRSLQKELGQANHALQRLGIMATLANQMIVQNLVTVITSEVKSFVINALKVKGHRINDGEQNTDYGDTVDNQIFH